MVGPAGPPHRLKDIIYGFGTNNVYVVLECLDCDLRHLLDAERQLDMRQIKVSTPPNMRAPQAVGCSLD